MKKKIVRMLAALLVLAMMAACFAGCSDGGTALNVKVMETTDRTVRFRPVCPSCNAMGKSRTEILYIGEGDSFEDVEICFDCGYVFDIGLTRD